MLASTPLNAFFRTTDSSRSRVFYEQVLGLTFESENEHVVVFRGAQYAVVGLKRNEFTPESSTVIGWEVEGIETVVAALSERGVVFERYDWMQQDKLGIWKSPDGRVAWFKDPDGNVLSVGEHGG